MGYFTLIPIATMLLIVGIVTGKEKLYMLSSIFWFILGFYCFGRLEGANPVSVWNGWLGIISIMLSLYIMWDEIFGEFKSKRLANRKDIEQDEFGEDIKKGEENTHKRIIRIVRNPRRVNRTSEEDRRNW